MESRTEALTASHLLTSTMRCPVKAAECLRSAIQNLFSIAIVCSCEKHATQHLSTELFKFVGKQSV